MEQMVVSAHVLRASAAFNSNESVAFSPTSLMRFAQNVTLYFQISDAAALDFEAELLRSPDNVNWFSVERFGPYTEDGNLSEDVRDKIFGQHQMLLLTRNSGSCTLKVSAEIEEAV